MSTSALPFATLMRLKRFARVWDVVANRGRFPRVLPLLLGDSPFARFMEFAESCCQQLGSTREMHLQRLAELLFEHLTETLGMDLETVTRSMVADYCSDAGRKVPGFLHLHPGLDKSWLFVPKTRPAAVQALPDRQARHALAQAGV